MAGRENYSIDAPGVVRALGLFGIILTACRFLPNDIPGASIVRKFWPTGISVLAAAAC
jgi:hypothetical protein